jgi:hypothetical protein
MFFSLEFRVWGLEFRVASASQAWIQEGRISNKKDFKNYWGYHALEIR